MTAEELDEWAIGVVYGLCRVLSLGDCASGRREYPVSAAFCVDRALKHIAANNVPCAPEAIRFAQAWLDSVGGRSEDDTQQDAQMEMVFDVAA